MPPPRPKAKKNSDGQDWGMLIFESLSAGTTAVFIAMAAILVLAGIYCLAIWPLTHWDLAHVGGEALGKYLLFVIFASGTAAGFWTFSGAAFRDKGRNQRGPVRPRR